MRRQNVIEECGAGNVGKVIRSLIIIENSGEKMLDISRESMTATAKITTFSFIMLILLSHFTASSDLKSNKIPILPICNNLEY